MPNPRLAGRYAKSLIDLAIEKGQLEQVFSDMLWLKEVCKSSRDFVNLLRSPIVKPDKKEKILTAITSGKINNLTSEFNKLLVRKGRESYLPEIISTFIDQYKKYKNIYTVQLTSAAPLSDTMRNSIKEQVKHSSGYQNIELAEQVDDKLIGGFVLQLGDKLVDASVAYDLKNISKQFENNDFIYKIR